MAVLVTAGTGKTSTRLEKLLSDANIPFVLTSRRGPAAAPAGLADKTVAFDMLDESTFSNPFDYNFPNGEKITSLYLVTPETQDPIPAMNSFIDYAVDKGVKRIVMLSGSSAEKGGFYVGQVWAHLDTKGIDYTLLRATWFNENFSEHRFVSTLKDEDKIYTACGDGKMPFVAVGDIAASAFAALTSKDKLEESYRILGPELLNYDEVAATFTKVLRRPIIHVKISQEESKQKHIKTGLPEHHAALLAMLENMSANNGEAREGHDVEKLTGKKPQTLESWIEENKAVWT